MLTPLGQIVGECDGRQESRVRFGVHQERFADLVGDGAAHASDEDRYAFGQLKA